VAFPYALEWAFKSCHPGGGRSLPSETGHILRHTYRTIAQRIALDKIEARLLLDHTVPGIDGVYIHEKALFDKLLMTLERMSAIWLLAPRLKIYARLLRVGAHASHSLANHSTSTSLTPALSSRAVQSPREFRMR
jgi:hypothetical protein